MTKPEKFLYHQIHPLKLLTDFASSFASTALFWDAQWLAGSIVAFAPALIISALIVSFADLERYKHSKLGHYLCIYMTPKIMTLRMTGQIVMWLGAGLHVLWLVPLGFVIIVFAWLDGLWAQDTAHQVRP